MSAQAEKVEKVSCQEVADSLGTSRQIVKAGIINGSLPIGFVARGTGSKDRIIIFRERWDKYRRGEL